MTEQRLQEIEASIGRIECPECGGSGVYLDVPTGNEACDECDGSGMVSQFPPADELIAAVRTLTADLAHARAERDEAHLVVVQLRNFVAHERAVRDSVGKGGQHVGNSPRITPSVLHELERMMRHAPDTTNWLGERLKAAEATIATLRAELQAAQAPCMCCREVTQPCQHGCRCAHPTPAQEGQDS